MSIIIEELQSLIDLYFTFLVIAIGLFNFFVDTEQLKRKKLEKEKKISKIIGITYMISAPIIFIVLAFM